MGLEEDVEDLKAQIKKSLERKNKEETLRLLKQGFSLYDKVKQVFETADAAEKEKTFKIMQGFREFLAGEIGKAAQRMGLTQDQLIKYHETPENFSKEQWMLMKEIKERFASKGRAIRKAAKPHQGPTIKATSPEWKPMVDTDRAATAASRPVLKKKKIVARRVKKNKWLKS